MACDPFFVTVDFVAATGVQTTATLERGPSATGPWTFIRDINLVGQVGATYDTTPPPGETVWYRWTGHSASPDVFIVQGPFVIPATTAVCLRDPLRPWANLAMDFCASKESLITQACTPGGPAFIWSGWGEKVRRADAGLFDRFDTETPADVYGRRKNLDTSIRFLTKTLAAKNSVYELFTWGGPIQIVAPVEYGWEQYFVQPGDLTETYLSDRVDQRRPHRIWTAPATVVDDAATGPIQGTACANWCAVEAAFPTFADMTAAGGTWMDILEGETQC